MNIVTKLIYRFYLITMGLFIVASVIIGILLFFWNRQLVYEKKIVDQAIILVKQKISYQNTDYFGGCVIPKSKLTIVSVDHRAFFAVKGNEVFIPRLGVLELTNARKFSSTLEVKDEKVQPYYLYEYCLW